MYITITPLKLGETIRGVRAILSAILKRETKV